MALARRERGLRLVLFKNREWEQTIFHLENSKICSFLVDRLAHHLCINKMEFKPNDNGNILASCGNDGLVRVYAIEIEK